MEDKKGLIHTEVIGSYLSSKEVFTICYIKISDIEIHELNIYELISKKGQTIKFKTKPLLNRQFLKSNTSVEDILDFIKEKYGNITKIGKGEE